MKAHSSDKPRVITEAEWHRLRGDTPSELKGQPEADPIMRKESIGTTAHATPHTRTTAHDG